jgi:hypothetical protein
LNAAGMGIKKALKEQQFSPDPGTGTAFPDFTVPCTGMDLVITNFVICHWKKKY